MTEPEEMAPAPDAEFEQFWAKHAAREAERRTVMGVEITVPTDLPLDFEERAAELQDSEDEKDVKELLTMLFGGDVMRRWAANGMTIRQFQFMLAWAVARGGGRQVSYEDFWPEFERLEAKGKAPNRADRRAARKNNKKKLARGGSSRTHGSATAGN